MAELLQFIREFPQQQRYIVRRNRTSRTAASSSRSGRCTAFHATLMSSVIGKGHQVGNHSVLHVLPYQFRQGTDSARSRPKTRRGILLQDNVQDVVLQGFSQGDFIGTRG